MPAGWGGFDVAFSHEVLYLLHDLPSHARAIFDALLPGGTYYAVMGVHAGSLLMAEWHRANVDELRLPELYDIDSVVAAFQATGFEAAVGRIAFDFIPAAGHGHHEHGRLLDWLRY